MLCKARQMAIYAISLFRWGPKYNLPKLPIFLPRLYPRLQNILFGWQRAGGEFGKCAGRVVGLVEIELKSFVCFWFFIDVQES